MIVLVKALSKKEEIPMDEKNGIVVKKKHIIIAAILFLLILIGSVTVAFNWNRWFGDSTAPTETSSESENSAPELDIDPNAGAWDGQKPEDKSDGEQTGIKIPGYPSISIPADQKDVTVALLNPEGNPCYFKFTLVLKDSGETLYESKLVPPGEAITEITMSKALPEGEYDATIQITTLSLDGETPLNGANVETVLIAK